MVSQWRKRFFKDRLEGLDERARPGRPRAFPRPPELTVEIKALACELPAMLDLPLSRFSVADVARCARQSGQVGRISDSTVGGGCMRTRSVLGSIAAGSFRAIRTSKPKQGESWTSTRALGRAESISFGQAATPAL